MAASLSASGEYISLHHGSTGLDDHYIGVLTPLALIGTLPFAFFLVNHSD